MTGSIPAWAGEPSNARIQSRAARVYPRVGGGTPIACVPACSGSGLSPRGRGNPTHRQARQTAGRSIPAWAGEPYSMAVSAISTRVYPRVGGGTSGSGPARQASRGLSPRGRGNQARRSCPARCSGSIPAWAGEPSSSAAATRVSRVYPRVGGGTVRERVYARDQVGLSPRGRGNRAAEDTVAECRWSIPAWAGEPAIETAYGLDYGVYPRVGGGTVLLGGSDTGQQGLSPRGRGNHGRRNRVGQVNRSIPAWAGEPHKHSIRAWVRWVYPRVGGGTASVAYTGGRC